MGSPIKPALLSIVECLKQNNTYANPRLFFAVRDELASDRRGHSVSATILHIEKLVIHYGVTPVLNAFDRGLTKVVMADQQRMCVLVALKYIAMVRGSHQVEHYRSQLQSLISSDRLFLSLEAFSMEVMHLTYAGRADLAVDSLVRSFEWLGTHQMQDSGALNIAAAYVCKQFGQFEQALHFSYLGYSVAICAEDEFAINWASYFVLNSNRLACGDINLKPLFDNEISKLKSAQLDLGLHANFLLPVYAANHELLNATPDLRHAEDLLAFASECGAGVDPNFWASWSATKGCLQLKRGNTAAASDMLQHAERYHDRVDATVDTMKHVLRQGLGRRSKATELRWTPASARAWKQLRRCADEQNMHSLKLKA